MEQELLNKKNTAVLHGVAILMMIYHHIFISGNTWYINEGTALLNIFNSINIGGAPNAQQTFAWFCKICVAIFAFTSGYGIYKQFQNRLKGTYNIKEMCKYCFKRFLSFYKKYLICFIFFIGCEYFMGNQNGFDFSIENFVMNLFGLRATFNSTWWYISVYYLMLLVAPLGYLILNKVNYKGYLVIIGIFLCSFGIAFGMHSLLPYAKTISAFIQNYIIIYLLIFLEGMFVARYKWLDFIGNKLNLITAILLLIITYIARALLIRAPSDCLFDLIFTLPFVVSVAKISSYLKVLPKVFAYLGKYSAYIWYSHAYFYSYLFFGLVFKVDLSLLVFVQVVFYSLVCGIIFDNVLKLISSLKKAR